MVQVICRVLGWDRILFGVIVERRCAACMNKCNDKEEDATMQENRHIYFTETRKVKRSSRTAVWVVRCLWRGLKPAL